MFFRKIIGLGLMAMLIFGVLGLFGRGGYGRSQSAYTQGYIAGQQSVTVNEDGTTTTAPPPTDGYERGYGYGRSHVGFFPGFGLFFCLIPLFLFGGLFMMGGKRHWRHGRRHWRHHGHGPRSGKGHRPPWADDDNDYADEPVMKA